MDEWGWFFSSEYGRDKMLRSEIESLSYASASANASNARLSSQLARLQGSLESRLSALSAAFDAYVELGDVREQLSAYGDTAAIRRDAAAAIEALAAGRTPAPVEVGDGGYWLPYATNAVIALLAGTADQEAEERGRTLSRDADLFVAVTVGALGRGELVADRVPDLLVADEALRAPQVVLWEAVLAGVYPSRTENDLLDEIRPRWAPALATGDGAEWRTWVGERSGAPDAVGDLRWIRKLVAGRRTVTADPGPDGSGPGSDADPAHGAEADATTTATDPRSRLQAAAGEMVAEGSEAERDLLYRARELRRRIEEPGGPPVPASRAEAPLRPVRELVRDLLDAPDAALRARAVDWLRPGLLRAVDEIASTPESVPPAQEVRTPGGSLLVSPAGPDPGRLAQVQSNVVAAHATSDRTLIGAGAGAGVLAVAALVVGLTGVSAGLTAVLVIVAVVLAVVALRALRQRSVARTELAADTALFQRSLDQGLERARAAQAAYDEEVSAVAQLVRELHSALQPTAVS